MRQDQSTGAYEHLSVDNVWEPLDFGDKDNDVSTGRSVSVPFVDPLANPSSIPRYQPCTVSGMAFMEKAQYGEYVRYSDILPLLIAYGYHCEQRTER